MSNVIVVGCGRVGSQLANMLSDGIASGDWRANQALPSERVLSDILEISRVTARKAIDMLCDRGMLTRKRGVTIRDMIVLPTNFDRV